MEYTANIPTATSATKKVGTRWLGADDTVVDESVTQRSLSGVLNCTAFGNAICAGVNHAIDVDVAVQLGGLLVFEGGFYAAGVAARDGFPP